MLCRVYDSVPVLYDTSPNQMLLSFLRLFVRKPERRSHGSSPSDFPSSVHDAHTPLHT